MKRFCRLLQAVVLIAFIVSCEGEPQAQKTPPPTAPVSPATVSPTGPPAPVPAQPATPAPVGPVRTQTPSPSLGISFDQNNVSKQEHDIALSEVQQLIRTLNSIIKAKNYDAWLSYLHPDYQELITSGEYLNRINNSQRFKSANMEITSARDYFDKVVVPSRANDRVDDVEFVARNRVKAYFINRGNKLRLYDLEKTNSGWKIVG
jgi:hypothetical protein